MSRSPEGIRSRLAEVVGQSRLVSGEKASTYSLDGEQPLAAVFPLDEREVSEIAGLADGERLPVVVWGGGTKQGVEPSQRRDGIVLGTRRLDTTAELDVANLTVTVGAGKVVDDLQRELAPVGLFLPLDPIDSAGSTIGGMLAANSSGPNRLLYRTARDWVLGLRVVTPSGDILRLGGKTVKDVAGYDLKKLYIGSWGTLGAITQATFRLLPLPEASATVAMAFPSLSSACSTVLTLLASFMRPSAADLLSFEATPISLARALGLRRGEYLLMISVEGIQEATERQQRELQELASRNDARDSAVFQGTAEKELWRQRKWALAEPPRGKIALLLKASVLLRRLSDFTSSLVLYAQEEGYELSIASHAGNGIVYAMVATSTGQDEKLALVADRIQRLAADHGGFAMVQRGPRGVSERIALWPLRSDYGLMRAVKAQLDPNNLWSPARTPGGISG